MYPTLIYNPAMDDAPDLPCLPHPPAGMYRFGWYGIALFLPQNWNLSFHVGTAKRGVLIFNDLSGPRFEIRWRTPRRFRLLRQPPAAALQHLVSRLEPRHKATLLPAPFPAFRVQRGESTLLLAADRHRVYELSWPAGPQDFDTRNLLIDFFQTLQLLETSPRWLWEVYGARGWLPPDARLGRCLLLPGKTELRFLFRGGRCVLGASSLADRLLANRTLVSWASSAIPTLKTCRDGAWQESADQASCSKDAPRLFPCPHVMHHRLTITHDRLANRIRWTHQCEKVKKGNMAT